MSVYIKEGSLVKIDPNVSIYGQQGIGLLLETIIYNSSFISNYKTKILYRILFKKGIHIIAADDVFEIQ